MNHTSKNKSNKGMTVPELVMATLMLTAFTSVFIVVARFTANFLQPVNVEGEKNFEYAKDISIKDNEMPDIMNDHLKINVAIDSIISFLSQPGIDKETILKLKCTSLPYLDWEITSISDEAIPKQRYNICLKPTLLAESSYMQLNAGKGKPGIYIIYSKPLNGITYNATPVRRIFCRPKPFCKL